MAALFAWAAWQRFALPLDPIADPDTWGYLSPALRKLVGSEFGHTHGRNFAYPAFVFSLLRCFADFRAIVVTQHLLGLLAGTIFLLIWRRSWALVRSSRLSRESHDGFGLVATAIFLLAGEPIAMEMQLRPEGVVAFLISVTLYFAIQFMVCCFLEKRPAATVGNGIGICFMALLLASAKPSFGLVAAVTLLPVGIFFFRRGWFRQKVTLATGAILSAASLLMPEYFLSRHDDVARTLLPTQLFVMHADLIRDQMADDLQRNAKTPYPRELVERVHDWLGTELIKSTEAHPGHFPSLGFCPDYLMYDRGSIDAKLRQEFGNDVAPLCAFYWYYYERIWWEKPLLVIRKIGRQLARFYSRMCPAYNRAKSLNLTNGYRNGLTSLESERYLNPWMAYPPAVRFLDRTELLARDAPPIEQPLPVRLTLSLLARLYRPLLLGTAVLGIAFLCIRNYRNRLGWLVTWVAFTYLWNWTCCLEVAIVHSLDVPRYSTVQVFFTILAQFSALWLLCEIVFENRRAANEGP